MSEFSIDDTQIRVLPMPDGTFKSHRDSHQVWKTYDYIQEQYDITDEWLIDLVHADMEENDVSFEDAFNNIVAYVCREHDKAFGASPHF